MAIRYQRSIFVTFIPQRFQKNTKAMPLCQVNFLNFLKKIFIAQSSKQLAVHGVKNICRIPSLHRTETRRSTVPKAHCD